MAKNFTNTNTFNNLTAPKNKQEVKEVPTVQEVQITQETLTTQGRKGHKLQRINMGFTPQNIEFLRLYSKVQGLTMTQLTNKILDEVRQEPKTAEKLQQIKEIMKEG